MSHLHRLRCTVGAHEARLAVKGSEGLMPGPCYTSSFPLTDHIARERAVRELQFRHALGCCELAELIVERDDAIAHRDAIRLGA